MSVRTRQEILGDFSEPDLTLTRCGELYRELHSLPATRSIQSHEPQPMQITRIRTLHKLEQEMFENALHLLSRGPDPAMRSMASSALSQKMYEHLLWSE